jgi:uncharacterized protein YbaP (TraB family)
MPESTVTFTGIRTDLMPQDVYAALEPAWVGKPQALPLPRLKPWAAMLAASVMSLNFQPGVETLFQQQLPRASYGYLETDDQLGALFDSVPQAAVLEGLRRTLAMLPQMQQSFEESYEGWVRWDVPALVDGQRRRPLGAVEELRQAGLIQRNRNWVEQIASYPKDGTRYLFVVGYEHLIGPESVVELLGSKGMSLSLVSG